MFGRVNVQAEQKVEEDSTLFKQVNTSPSKVTGEEDESDEEEEQVECAEANGEEEGVEQVHAKHDLSPSQQALKKLNGNMMTALMHHSMGSKVELESGLEKFMAQLTKSQQLVQDTIYNLRVFEDDLRVLNNKLEVVTHPAYGEFIPNVRP
eukprot:Nk52_evm9s2578 gene=Nk52_evmTU9s2578